MNIILLEIEKNNVLSWYTVFNSILYRETKSLMCLFSVFGSFIRDMNIKEKIQLRVRGRYRILVKIW